MSNINGGAASGEQETQASADSMNGSASGPTDGEHVRKRTKSGSKPSGDAEKSYTKEQLEAVKKYELYNAFNINVQFT